jgi:hypothetical protein
VIRIERKPAPQGTGQVHIDILMLAEKEKSIFAYDPRNTLVGMKAAA